MFTNEDELHPIIKAIRLRDELGKAVSNKKWKRSHNLAIKLIKQIDLCMSHKTAHLDGLFCIGTMLYQRAPKKSIDAIDRFNARLKSARGKIQK
jgi:hypothetical protein